MIALSASEVSIETIVRYCESLAHELMKNHEKRFAERIRAIGEASNALTNTASRFGWSVKNAWGEMEKSTSEYGMRLAQIIQETAQPLTRAQRSSTFAYSEEFHQEAVQDLNKIIVTVRKYVPKLPKGLKTEMAALNAALARLERAVRALGEALDESPGTKIESLQRDAALLMQRQDELLKLRGEENERARSQEALTEQERGLLTEEKALSSQEEFRELKNYEEISQSKEEEIRQFFQPIVKPLVKLERAAAAKPDSAIDTGTLHGLVETPIETVTGGQSFSIVQLLEQLEEALGRGELDIEERKLRKAEETIQQSKSGAIDAMRQEYLVAQANIQEALRQLRAKGLLEKRDRIEELIVQTRRESEDMNIRLKDFRRRIDNLASDISKRNMALESQIMKLARRSITIRAS